MVEEKYYFSQKSKDALFTCAPDIVTLFLEVIKYFDCKVLEGHRGKETQETAYRNGASKVHWPYGKHNSLPSSAVDVTPMSRDNPVNLNDKPRHIFFGGYVVSVADRLFREGKITHKIRWGGDWDGDRNPKDGWDFVHFELITT